MFTAIKLHLGKGQQGQAFLLVLVALALGSMLITPTIQYVYTGQTEAQVLNDMLLDQYSADAAVEYHLWQLTYNVDGITEGLNPENPSSNDIITVNGIEIPIITEITESPLGEDWPFPIPQAQSGIALEAALVLEPPHLSEDGLTAYFVHKVYMFNSGDASVHMKGVFQQLDPQLTYVPGSYDGPDADLTMDYIDDHWELYCDFATPLPTLGKQEATFISFVTSTGGDIGDNFTYSSTGRVDYAAFGAEEGALFEGECAPTTIGQQYDITVTSGSYVIIATVGMTAEGDIIIRSYQVQSSQ